MGLAWSIYGGILDVNLKLFVLSAWDKMARLGKIFINEILMKTNNQNRAKMGALHIYSIIIPGTNTLSVLVPDNTV